MEEKKRAEVGKGESVITEEMNGKELSPGSGPGETRKVEPMAHKDSTSLSSESSSSSSESEEDVGEYQPHHRVTEGTIREEQEYEEELEEEPGQGAKVVEREAAMPEAIPDRQAGASVLPVETEAQENVVAQKLPGEKGAHRGTAEQDMSEEAEEDQHRVNGEVPHLDIDGLPEIVCPSEVNGRLGMSSAAAVSQVETPAILHLPLILLGFFSKDLVFLSCGKKGWHCFVASRKVTLASFCASARLAAGRLQPPRLSLIAVQFSFACSGCFLAFLCTASLITRLSSWVYVVNCVCTVES